MKKIEKYDFKRKPKRASAIFISLAMKFISDPFIKKFDLKIEKKNMDGLKPPYLLLATHASETDMHVMFRAVAPFKRINTVTAIDGIRDHGDGIMRMGGCIAKRKFIKDYDLIRNMRYCVKEYGDIVCIYPEARYSFDGCISYIPPSVGKMCKLLGIPVVTLRMFGNFISSPQWNKNVQYLPLKAEIEQIVTAEELKTISVDEINARIIDRFTRDDYAYQLENKIENKYERRAEGLHNILYRCPHCNTEFKMYSKGTRLYCKECGKGWQMSTLGQLSAEEGETEFSHIPDWFNWERSLVREEVRSGKYRFEDEVEVHTLPNAKKFEYQGRGKLVQTCEGTVLDCTAYGEGKHIVWEATELESAHIEYDYPFEKKKYKLDFGDCIDLSTPEDSYWCHPVNKRTQLTKFSFATEEIYFLALEKVKEGK